MKKSAWMSEKEYRLVTSKTPIPTVDLVVLRKDKDGYEVLSLIRKTGYAKGKWCIIGGRIWKDEAIEDTIKRQAKDLKLEVKVIPPFDYNFPALVNDHLNQDETKHSICNVYPVMIIGGEIRQEGEEYKGFKWFPVDKLPKLAYDHKFEILEIVKRLNKFYGQKH